MPLCLDCQARPRLARLAALARVAVLAVLGGACVLALPARTSAQATPEVRFSAASGIAAKLAYERDAAAQSCPDAAALQEAVSEELGSRVFSRVPLTHEVLVQVAAEGGGLRAQVSVRSAQGIPLAQQTLSAASTDCTELSRAMVHAISAGLDPARALAPSRAAGGTTPPPATCPAPPACAPCAATSTASATPDAQHDPALFNGISVLAGVGAAFGALPSTSGAGFVELGATWTRASVHVGAALHPGVRGGEVTRSTGARELDVVDAQLVLGQLALCARAPLSARLAFSTCSVTSLGALRGRDVQAGTRSSELAAALGLQARLQLALTDALFAQARTEAHADLARTTLHASGERAWTSPPVWAGVALALGVRF